MVLQKLQEEGFNAGVAYPGQLYPRITQTMAAVHIEKVDRANLTVTVEVNMICPAALGGTKCEEEALRATEALRRAGAVCVQNGCRYDGISQVYVVPVSAAFTCITNGEAFAMGPGFQVHIDGIDQKYAVRFRGVEELGYKAEYVMGESAPAGISRGPCLWHIELEELFPYGTSISTESTGTFELKVAMFNKMDIYSNCRWTSVERQLSREGLRRICKGIAMLREGV